MFSPALRPRSKLLRAGLQTFSHGPLRRRTLPRNARWLTSPASPEHAKGPLPGQQVDNEFAEAMGFVTTYLRAVESARTDHIIYDPFAEPLTRKDRLQIQQFMNTVSGKYHRSPEDMIAIRTRYLDEALSHRNPEIHQIVLLGAGLDARAYRLEALRDCHVLEIDQGAAMFDHKSDVMTELHAPMLAKQVDCIVFNLADAGLEVNLLARGFDPTRPTFWAMEGLLPYMDRPSNVELLKAIDYLSWPGSEFYCNPRLQ
ncbi:hypothetical protein BBJ28_00024678 [Nothophytophthora sp. Chile5]|nr:hypothetical protein BBJ28_00024678 [Nothophytophthora sp. Chile5]